jgi:hypothetical protein
MAAIVRNYSGDRAHRHRRWSELSATRGSARSGKGKIQHVFNSMLKAKRHVAEALTVVERLAD